MGKNRDKTKTKTKSKKKHRKPKLSEESLRREESALLKRNRRKSRKSFRQRWIQLGQRARKRVQNRKKRRAHLIKLPWYSTQRELFRQRKALHKSRAEVEVKKLKRRRVKFPERLKPLGVGPGYPAFALIWANMEIARNEKDRKVIKRTPSGTPIAYEPLRTDLPRPVSDGRFKDFCHKIGVHSYDVDHEYVDDPAENNGIQVKQLDLYYEDIRVERNLLLKELKHLPLTAPVALEDLQEMEKSIVNAGRTCYYSPVITHRKSEDILHVMVWLLNRKNIPIGFHIKILQAVSMVVYTSPVFKSELVMCGGIQVLFKSMQVGIVVCPLQACWACYALSMAAIGSPEVITELQSIPDFDETVGEMSFGMLWYYWPANFATILQALVFGPGGVGNTDDNFSFI